MIQMQAAQVGMAKLGWQPSKNMVFQGIKVGPNIFMLQVHVQDPRFGGQNSYGGSPTAHCDQCPLVFAELEINTEIFFFINPAQLSHRFPTLSQLKFQQLTLWDQGSGSTRPNGAPNETWKVAQEAMSQALQVPHASWEAQILIYWIIIDHLFIDEIHV